MRLKEPMILGHEVLARVETLEPGVTGFSVGKLGAVSPSRPSGAQPFGLKFCFKKRFNRSWDTDQETLGEVNA